jgi:hypothetical protein
MGGVAPAGPLAGCSRVTDLPVEPVSSSSKGVRRAGVRNAAGVYARGFSRLEGSGCRKQGKGWGCGRGTEFMHAAGRQLSPHQQTHTVIGEGCKHIQCVQ